MFVLKVCEGKALHMQHHVLVHTTAAFVRVGKYEGYIADFKWKLFNNVLILGTVI